MGCGISLLNDILKAVADSNENANSNDGHVSPTAAATTTSPSSYGGASPIYSKLPQGAEEYPVRNVYDGDTLTLVDERRIRFLGVDTPELKEQQPYAQEAKDYTKGHCHKKDIYLVSEGKDHYDRVLGWIYVAVDGGYLCVNEGLVAEGYAYAYTPKKDDRPFNWDKLVSLQSQARKAKKGVWKTFVDKDVVATANGSAYHDRSCEHLSNVRHLTEMKISEAADKGLHPCRTCMG